MYYVYSILKDLWYVSVDCLAAALETIPAKKSSKSETKYRKLRYILESIREFFHAEGNGLDKATLNSKNYLVCGGMLSVDLVTCTDVFSHVHCSCQFSK